MLNSFVNLNDKFRLDRVTRKARLANWTSIFQLLKVESFNFKIIPGNNLD